MLVIGLTGGIASGKSTVSRMLQEQGAEIIDADSLVHEVTQPGTDCLRRIIEAFGPAFLNPDGSLNRRRLGRLVFNDEDELRKLNAIVHPQVIEIIKSRIENARASERPPEVLVVDAPLLIEAGLVPLVDEVWVVAVDQNTQMERLMTRDRLNIDETLARIRAQIPLEDKIKIADVVIDNSGGVAETECQVKQNLARGVSKTRQGDQS